MNAADPPAALALDIKLLEETDPSTDEEGIKHAKSGGTPVGAGAKPGKHREDYYGQKDPCQLATRGNRERGEGQTHGVAIALISAARMEGNRRGSASVPLP